MADFHQIWQFIERKMGVTVPPYIKYVLKYCGYENCHTISTIEDNDFAYIESEVRKGGIIEYYKGEVLEAEILKGSAKKLEEFEIIRGHQRLIISAATLVKETLEANGVDVFSTASPKRKNNSKNMVKNKTEKPTESQGKTYRPGKKPKLSPVELLSESMLQSIDDEISTNVDPLADPHIKHHKYDLLVKGLSHLKSHNSVIYDEMSINKKFTVESVQVAKKSDSEQYAGKLKCPFCDEHLNVFHKLTKSELGSWNTSNFERHLTIVHADTLIPFEKTIKKPTKPKTYKEVADNVNDDVSCKESPDALPPPSELSSESQFKNKIVDGRAESNVPATVSLKKSAGTPLQLEFRSKIEGFDNHVVENGYITDSIKRENISPLLDDPLFMTMQITSNGSPTQNHTVEAKEDYAFIIVPSMNGEGGMEELKCDDNGVIQGFTLFGSENIGNSSVISNTTQSRIGERLIFRNGGCTNDGSWNGSRLIHTRNTCGFDSILEIYAAIYFDNQHYREFLDVTRMFFRCDFTTLVHEYFQTNSSTPKLQVTQIYSAWESLNRNRNLILKTIFRSEHYKQFPHLKEDDRFTYIDCRTGLGEFFAELASTNLILSSEIETKICHNCQSATTKIVPFLSIDGMILDLSNVQRSIDQKLEKNGFVLNVRRKSLPTEC